MKKNAIVYGECKTPVYQRAIEELSTILLDYTLEYPVCIRRCEHPDTNNYRYIYIGTKESNEYIRRESKYILTESESYAICVKDSTVMIEGYDDAGVLYGVLDLCNKYLAHEERPHTSESLVNPLEKDNLTDFEYICAPSVKERGLWTWGHVIYDYRGYIDNMMRLKMNAVIIWNDFLPLNAKDIVEYAHARNIKVYWGFAWLWDTSCNKVNLGNLEEESVKIARKFEAEYASAIGDGIYFQTFTEMHEDNIDGTIVAEAAAKFVNDTAALIYKEHPNVELLFGLHATSVKDRLSFIEAVDKRIKIVWEDCGAFPFSYSPTDTEGYEETKEFISRISALRGNDERYGVVTKGLVKLDWNTFEHPQGPQCIGVCSEYARQNRMDRKRPIWRYIQGGWMMNADKAQDMVRHMCKENAHDLSVFALVEDGMFEKYVMYPVALYAEILWSADKDIKDIINEVSLRKYVSYP